MTRGREPAAWWGAGALVALALLVPSMWNGFPLLFSDSGEYLAWAWGVVEPRYRTLGYSAFIRIGAVVGSVWPVVFIQSAWAAAVLVIAWRTVWPASSALAYGLGGLALAAGTALSLVTSQLMPDLWSGLVVVSAALVVTAWAQLSTRSRAVLITTLVVGGAMHVTHLAIGAGVVLVAGHCVRRRSTWRAALEPTGRALLALAGGATLAIGLSGAMTGRAVLSRNGHIFVLAHLVDTGIAQRLLREHCDTRAYALCPYRAALDTLDGESFVWHPETPFRALGGWSMPPAEAERMLADAWRDHPMAMAWQGVTLSAAQFVAVRPDDALRIGDRQLLNLTFANILSDDQREFLAARQQRGPLPIPGLVTLHQGVAMAAWLLGAILLVTAVRRSAGLSGDLLVAAWVGLATNAVLCANFAVVRDRYQARMLWVLPLAVILDLAVRRSARAR